MFVLVWSHCMYTGHSSTADHHILISFHTLAQSPCRIALIHVVTRVIPPCLSYIVSFQYVRTQSPETPAAVPRTQNPALDTQHPVR